MAVTTSPGSGLVTRERVWKLVSTLTGLIAALVAKRIIRVGYAAVRSGDDPATPFDSTDARFAWPNALLWAAAAGIGLGVAKIAGTRLAAIGWEAATGTAPPEVKDSPTPA